MAMEKLPRKCDAQDCMIDAKANCSGPKRAEVGYRLQLAGSQQLPFDNSAAFFFL
jgi:hypothetical protein